MTKYISIEKIRELSRQSKKSLYGDESQLNNNDFVIESSSNLNNSPTFLINNHGYNPFHIKTNKQLNNALEIMKAQINHDFIFLFRNETSKIAGIKGAASLLQAENEAIKQGIIKKHQIAKGKTQKCLWEIIEPGYEMLNCSPKQYRSKGEYVHKFCSHRIAETFTKYGYKARIEHRLSTGKLVDLCLFKDDILIYVEICASKPINKELVNLENDLDCEPFPSKIIFAVTDRIMKTELEAAFSQFKTQKELICPIEITLAGDMIENIEV